MGMFERAGFSAAGGTPLRPTTGTPRMVMRRPAADPGQG
jgi:hypothetical protein